MKAIQSQNQQTALDEFQWNLDLSDRLSRGATASIRSFECNLEAQLGAIAAECEIILGRQFKIHCSSPEVYFALLARKDNVNAAIAYTARQHKLPLSECSAVLIYRDRLLSQWTNIQGSKAISRLGINPVARMGDLPPFDLKLYGGDFEAIAGGDDPVYVQLQGGDSPVLWANKAARGVQALENLIGVSGLTLDFSAVISYLIRGLSPRSGKMSSFEFPGWRTVKETCNGIQVVSQRPHLFAEDWYYGEVDSTPVRVGRVIDAQPISHQQALDRLTQLS